MIGGRGGIKLFFFIFIYLFFGGGTNERPGTDYVTSGSMRGPDKTAPDGANKHTDRQTDGHGDSMTE